MGLAPKAVAGSPTTVAPSSSARRKARMGRHLVSETRENFLRSSLPGTAETCQRIRSLTRIELGSEARTCEDGTVAIAPIPPPGTTRKNARLRMATDRDDILATS